MKPISKEVLFFGAKRTAFGSFGGSIKNLSPTELGVVVSRAALAQSSVSVDDFDHVVFGQVIPVSGNAAYLARHVALHAGLPPRVPALTVNRLCGSGFEALVQAAMLMLLDQAELVLAGAVESMSQAPHLVRGARWGIGLGKNDAWEDALQALLLDSYPNLSMGLTAENLATHYQITQDEVDEYAVLSQQRFAAAQQAGRLDAQITACEVPIGKGKTQNFARDECNRPDTTRQGLLKLSKVFKKDGVIHAGAASAISDGAAALIMGTRAYAEKHGCQPLGRLLGWAHAGCDPAIMGIGPVPAIRQLMKRHQITLDEVDLIEINEAFAPQYLAVEKELKLDRAKTNVAGGAIAVGHPLAASGARITMHLLYELKARGQRLGIGSACIGGGQGIAVLVEAL